MTGGASGSAGAGAGGSIADGGVTATGGRTGTGGMTGAGGAGTANITVWLAGDSTMATGGPACPIGWGGKFQAHFNARARVVNSADNASFLHTRDMANIGDATIDLAYSVAVAQHLTDSALERVFDTLRRKLKPGGRLLLHVVLDAEGWRTEEEWKRDASLAGRLKLKYGLNCFTRSEPRLRDMLETAGFQSIVVRSIREICPEPFDDVCTQHLVCARA